MGKATKSIEFKFNVTKLTKDASGECIIEGYANTSTKDRVGDVVLPKAFEKTLATYMSNPVVLKDHNWSEVVGRTQHAEITDKGLYVRARISDTCPDVKTLIKEGCLSTFSIGYNELDADMDEGTQTKIVKELELLEISIVSVPANTEAMFTQIAEKAPAPAEEQEPSDEEKPKGEEKKSKSAGELKNFITTVKAAVGNDLGDSTIIAVIDYFNSNEELMTKDELLKELRKSLPEPKSAKDDAAQAAKPADASQDAPAGDDAMKALMNKINAIAEALAQMMEKLDKLEQMESDEQSEDSEEDAEKPAEEGKADDKPKPEEDDMKDDDKEKGENDAKPADKPGSAEDEKDKEDKDKEDMSAEDAEKAIAEIDQQLKELEDADNA